MDIEEDGVKIQAGIVIGEDLAMISIEELEKRIALLESEIARIRAEIDIKHSSRAAADEFFK